MKVKSNFDRKEWKESADKDCSNCAGTGLYNIYTPTGQWFDERICDCAKYKKVHGIKTKTRVYATDERHIPNICKELEKHVFIGAENICYYGAADYSKEGRFLFVGTMDGGERIGVVVCTKTNGNKEQQKES